MTHFLASQSAMASLDLFEQLSGAEIEAVLALKEAVVTTVQVRCCRRLGAGSSDRAATLLASARRQGAQAAACCRVAGVENPHLAACQRAPGFGPAARHMAA